MRFLDKTEQLLEILTCLSSPLRSTWLSSEPEDHRYYKVLCIAGLESS